MAYKLGSKSLMTLKGVHPDLVKVVKRAIEITSIDFTVIEGLRTRARQRQLVRKGASKTMNSRHITGHAVDIAPLIGGKVRWDWPLFFKLADAMKQAAKEVGVKVRWGGNWRIHDIASSSKDGKAMNKAYPGSFPDGPHFELSRRFYG